MNRWAVALAGAACASCQNYTLEEVAPAAIAQTTQIKMVAQGVRPDVMLLIDKSGSMGTPIDPTRAACRVGQSACGTAQGQSPCPASCPTRLSDMQAAMANLLSNYPAVARLGMAQFPSDERCAATSRIDRPLPAANVNDDASLRAASAAISASIAGLRSGGGTPTAGSLRFASSAFDEVGEGVLHQKFMLLLTDGEPNCADGMTTGAFDSTGTLAAVRELRNRNIQTIVVGFGQDVGSPTSSPSTRQFLGQLALEGGFARLCPQGTHAECGAGNICDASTRTCSSNLFQATDAASLGATLETIFQSFNEPCRFRLTVDPPDVAMVSVFADGVSLRRDVEWRLASARDVEIIGDVCQRLAAAPPQSPIRLEVRVAESL